MDSDFVFIDPNKIPPRRSVKSQRYGQLRIKKSSGKIWEEDQSSDEKDASATEPPEFNLLAGTQPQIYLVGTSADPLTQTIFGLEVSLHSKPVRSHLARSLKAEPDQALPAGKPKSKTILREALLAELASIDSKDEELLKKISALEIPSRAVPIYLTTAKSSEPASPESEVKINVVDKKSFYTDFGEEESASSALAADSPDYYRAESDWFLVGLAAPSRISELRKYAEDKAESHGQILRAEAPQEKASGNFITYLAFFLLTIVPVSTALFLYSSGDNLIKTAFGNFNSRLLSTSSFTLVNAEEGGVFPQLLEIRSAIKSLGLASEAVDSITGFLEKNAEFSWLDIFKRKSAAQNFRLSDLESLAKTQNILAGLAAKDQKIAGLSEKFSREVAWLSFWNKLTAPGQNYLIVVTDENVTWPGGGQPQSYVVVKTDEKGLEPVAYGKFSALDAALTLKLAPPEPLKTISTAWLPSQSFWFLNFEDSARTAVNFFESTTGVKVSGLMAVSEDYLRSLGFKENIIFNPDSPNWFYALAEAISRKPVGRFESLAQTLKQGLTAHQVQFYFKDNELESFSKKSGWQSAVGSDAAQGDFLGVGWASLKGGAATLDLMEYRGEVFEDGSVMARLNIVIRQKNEDDSQNYFKIYLPQDSQLLKAEGFSPKEKIPEFDYMAQGFFVDGRLNKPLLSEIASIDFYEEGESSVAAGWVNLKSNNRGAIRLEYLLPIKIPRKDGRGVYNLKIIRPAQSEAVPFRFVAVPQAGVEITSLEPDGFVTENLGEYQGNLSQDLNLSASFLFSE